MIGGGDMKLIYNSLLVSILGGGPQSWHKDVLDEQSPNSPVFTMIISMQDDTRIDIQIKGKRIPEVVPLPTCPGCGMDITDFTTHKNICIPYISYMGTEC